MILDVLVSQRNDEVSLRLVRNPVNQRLNVRRNNKTPRRVEGLVQIPDHILCTKIQLAALNRQYAVFDVAELQAANLTHAKREPHRKQARQLNLCTTNHPDHLLSSRQLVHFRYLRRQRHIPLRIDTIHFQSGSDQILGFCDRLARFRRRLLVDRPLHHETVNLVNVQGHQRLQPVFEDVFIAVDRGRREYVLLAVNISSHSLSNRESALCCLYIPDELCRKLLCFPSCRCGDGFLFFFTLLVDSEIDLNPPVSGGHLFCICHSIYSFSQGIHHSPRYQYTPFPSNS